MCPDPRRSIPKNYDLLGYYAGKDFTMEKNIIKADDVKAFIIPNSLMCVKDILVPSHHDDVLKFVTSISELNGLNIADPENEQLVQIWWSSESLNSENISDHGISVEGVALNMGGIAHVPVSLFSGKKEGDIITLNFEKECYIIPSNFKLHIPVEFQWKVRLSQLDYRYSRFGPFEECLAKLMGR